MSVLIIVRSGLQYSLKCETFFNGLEDSFLPAYDSFLVKEFVTRILMK